MTFKKIMSAVMAGAMVLSMGMTAFASSTPAGQTQLEGEEGYEIEVGSSTATAVIKVQVPDAVGFIVNPYRLDAKNDDLGITSTDDTQIVSPLQKIVNKSDFKIKVGGKIYGYENNPEEAKLVGTIATTAPATGFAKEAKIEFCYEAGGNGDSTRLEASSAANHIPLTNAEAGQDLTAVEIDKTGDANDAYLFNFDGEAQDAPAVAWTDGDTFGATIAFTFTAVANAAGGSGATTYTVTIGTVTGGTVTADVSSAAAGAIVTLTPSPTTPGQNPTYTVTDADGGTVAVTGNTFTMPAKNVTVTASFS